MANPMIYEAFLDEGTTLITKKYDVADGFAIAMVMQAHEEESFSGHDDNPKIRTLDRAHEDARTVFRKSGTRT
jgi:hypothetical protein